MIEIRHIAVFVALAEERHFGLAARRLGVSQPRVSVLLRRIEDLLGTQLVERRPEVRLTPDGEAILPYFQSALTRVDSGVRLIEDRSNGIDGALLLGFPTWILATDIPEQIVRFRERFANVRVDLFDIGSREQIDKVRSGELSLGFVRSKPIADKDVVLEVLYEEPWRLAVPRDHALAHCAELSLADLSMNKLVCFPEHLDPDLHRDIRTIAEAAGNRLNVVQEAREWLAIVGLVRAGAGSALVPASIERLCNTGLSYLTISDLALQSVVCLCASTNPDPVTRSFKRFLQEDRRCASRQGLAS
ncbi:MAG TPA: LysR family transcriptional regulator [Vitreimonas sp.]|nr:LysR family transcriptional regulator [Vitreimonas sp.]